MFLQPVARFRKTGKLQIAAVAWWTIIWRKLLCHIEPLCWDWNCREVLLLTFCFGLAPREWFILIIWLIMLSSFGCDQLSWSNDCCRNPYRSLLLHRVNRVYHVIMVLSSEHVWFFKKRLLSQRVVKFLLCQFMRSGCCYVAWLQLSTKLRINYEKRKMTKLVTHAKLMSFLTLSTPWYAI